MNNENRPELLAATCTIALVIAVYAINGFFGSAVEMVRIWKQPEVGASIIREGERIDFLADRVAGLEKRTHELEGLEARVRAVMKEADKSHQALFQRVEALRIQETDCAMTAYQTIGDRSAGACSVTTACSGDTLAVTISSGGDLTHPPVPVRTLQPPPGWSFQLDQGQNATWTTAK